ncbi:hypothetical protein C8J57DRAFT_498595 [Mycena rebaudengoi]|nr:hypothetical protein C8J57DRAFT_498595 [Mycena rebaudengoi]
MTSQSNSDSSGIESPVFDPLYGTRVSGRFRYQDDANTLYYQYPTSIYVSNVAIRQSEARIQDAQLSSPTSATSGSEHGGDVLTLSQSLERNQGYFSMVPSDRPGSIPLAPSAPPDSTRSFGEYPEYNPSYHQSISIEDNKTTAPSAPPLVTSTSNRGSSKNTAVVIACRPCRGRKIRCDSNRPSCNNCVRRKNECIYDQVPRRRGPDKLPGTRERSCKKRPADGSSPPPLKRQRRESATSVSTQGLETDIQPSLSTGTSISFQESKMAATPNRKRELTRSPEAPASTSMSHYRSSRDTQPHPPPSLSSSTPLRIRTDLCKNPSPASLPSSDRSDTDTSPMYQRYATNPYVEQQPSSPFFQPPGSITSPQMTHRKFPIPSSSIVESNQRHWWNQFLDRYPLTDIVADLTYLFSDTGHWLCFLNLSFFLDMLWNPEERLKIQPAFILAGLALAELMRSSESERAHSGRTRANNLRDAAHKALHTAMSGGNGDWIDASLAEAALILVLYESSAHPKYHPDRVADALRFLDHILKQITVLNLDAADHTVSHFAPNAVPIVDIEYDHQPVRKCTCMPPGSPPPDRSRSYASPLGWDPTWTPIEVRNEECRRLSWSALSLATSYFVECVAFDREIPVLELSNPANYAILFPGELSDRISPAYCSPKSPSPKESVWALFCRTLLLWNFCNRLLKRPGTSTRGQQQKEYEAEALQESWNEAQAIQDSLDMHECNYETVITYLCQEYIYNVRMTVTQGLRKIQGLNPDIANTPGPLINPRQAMEWINYQEQVIKRVKLATHQLSTPQGYQLTRRPFQVSWFLNQLAICMQLWTHNTGLLPALELSKDFIIVVDVLNALWPCNFHRVHSNDLRQQVSQACTLFGVPPPPPTSYTTP